MSTVDSHEVESDARSSGDSHTVDLELGQPANFLEKKSLVSLTNTLVDRLRSLNAQILLGTPLSGVIESGSQLGSNSEETFCPQAPVSEKHKRWRSWLASHICPPWVTENMHLLQWKAALRCAIAAWISLLLVILPPTDRLLGQSSYLILVASFLTPPYGPFASVLKQEMLLLSVTVGVYAWTCLGVWLSNLAREQHLDSADLEVVYSGKFIETLPTTISAAFACIGASVLLYLKGRFGATPLITAVLITGCTVLDMVLTEAPMFPYLNYDIGKAVVVPVASHSAIALLCSTFIFPETARSQYRHHLGKILVLLNEGMKAQSQYLKSGPSTSTSRSSYFEKLVGKAEAMLGTLAVSENLMKKEVIFSRFDTRDFMQIHKLVEQLLVHADGMCLYFKGIRGPLTPTREICSESFSTQTSSTDPKRELLNTETSTAEQDVGIYATGSLLSSSCTEILDCCSESIAFFLHWVDNNEKNGYILSKDGQPESRTNFLQASLVLKARLRAVLDDFRTNRRQDLINAFRASIKFKDVFDKGYPSSHYLSLAQLYQYQLMQLSSTLIDILEEIHRLEKVRCQKCLWFPFMRRTDLAMYEDENRNRIKYTAQKSPRKDLRRSANALPPENSIRSILFTLGSLISALRHGNIVFAIKVGVLTALLTLPSFVSSTAAFAYSEKFVWGIVVVQTTMSRFHGDTVFGFISRVASTFLGGVFGMIIWYISRGNTYGLAAVAAICFPFFSFGRIYYSGPISNSVYFFLTLQLVIASSWQDSKYLNAFGFGTGFYIVWRRFVLVTAGSAASFLFSFLPPSKTLRRYLRATLATTGEQLGQLYCEVISNALIRRHDRHDIITKLTSIKNKLERTQALRQNILYEFSCDGKWPTQHYENLFEIQINLARLLRHFVSVTSEFDGFATLAFLRQIQFLEPRFQSEVLAVISLTTTSLRSCTPLPRMTLCPLIEKLALDDGSGDIFELTTGSIEYEQFISVTRSLAFSIIYHIDHHMMATKELVGEQYNIDGLFSYRDNDL